MEPWRIAGATLAGLMSMTAVVIASTVVASRWLAPGPDAVPGAGYLTLNLVASVCAAVLGGWLSARIGGGPALLHGALLAGTVLVLGVVSALQPSGSSQPVWYPLLVPLLGASGALLGAWLYAQVGAGPSN